MSKLPGSKKQRLIVLALLAFFILIVSIGLPLRSALMNSDENISIRGFHQHGERYEKNDEQAIDISKDTAVDKSDAFILPIKNSNRADVKYLIDKVNEDSIRSFLNHVLGERTHSNYKGAEHSNAVKHYIYNTFKRFKLEASRHEIETIKKYTAENIAGKLTGATRRTIIIGAHFDTVEGSPGADDNGSGVAAMLELARILSHYTMEFNILFVGFDLEETDMRGSFHFVKSLDKPSEVAGMINMDMIGYSSTELNSQIIPEGFNELFPNAYETITKDGARGDFLICIANENSRRMTDVFNHSATEYVKDLKTTTLIVPDQGQMVPSFRRSDHANFWDANIPAIYLGDGADTRNPYYHSPMDTNDKLDYKHITKVTKAVLAALIQLGSPNEKLVEGVPVKIQ